LSEGRSCPACLARLTTLELRLPHVAVHRCRKCGHRVATHDAATQTADYHVQYDQNEYLEALRASRTRQAALLAEILARAVGGTEELLDFGAGRGWFLDGCRAAGAQRIAGVDSSPLAVDGLAARGIEAVLVPATTGVALDLGRLSFRPRTLTLLDVVEHFPPQALDPMFDRILRECEATLAFVVIKVPVSDGTLYRFATLLARFGFPGPLEQLYQVGTMPPHYSYFSRRSLRTFLARHGLSVTLERAMPELDPAAVGGRVRALAKFPEPVAALGARALALVSLIGPRDALVSVSATRRATSEGA
jgi:hypothetical protein